MLDVANKSSSEMKSISFWLLPPLLGALTSLAGCSNSDRALPGSGAPPPAPVTVTGDVTGLTGQVVLQNNGADDLSVAANGPFSFSTPIQRGGAYAVSVKTQPIGGTCSVTHGSGVATAGRTAVSIACVANAYSVGGTISGLAGTVELQNNGGDDRSISTDGAFTFPTPVAAGSAFVVTVKTQPAGHTCTVGNGAGTMGSANVADVSVVCAVNSYGVGGTVTGLSGSVVIQNNSGDALTLTQDGAFEFPTFVANGGSYAVTVGTQPATQTCSVGNGSGTMGFADVTDVAVVCSTNTFTVGGSVSGIVGSVTLQNNAGDNLTINADGSFTFPAPVASGGAYQVTVLSQPALQTCSVTSGVGTVGAAPVVDVSVNCVDNTTLLAVTPTSFVIPVGAGAANVLVTNVGMNTAANVSAVLPSGWTAVVQDSSSCTALAPGASCTLSFESALPYVAHGNVSVGADNVTSPANVAAAFSIDGYLVWAVDDPSTASVVGTSDAYSGWSATYLNVGSMSLIDGAANTAQIHATHPGLSAASMCHNSTAGGATVGTWYLPAVCQMGVPGQGANCPVGLPNLAANLYAYGFGNFNGGYWSSTERNVVGAWLVTMTSLGTGQFDYDKQDPGVTRCVRSMPY